MSKRFLLILTSLINECMVFGKKVAKLNKRFRFVLSSFILSGIMLIATFFPFEKFLVFIPLFIFSTLTVNYFSILEGVSRIDRHRIVYKPWSPGWLMLFLMPVYMTVSFYLFYFLFPIRWLTRLPFIFIYLISIYALLLTSNIFNIGVEKSLQLFRAAFSVNFFYQVLVFFLITNVLFSLKGNFLLNGIGVMILSFPLALHLLWSVKPRVDLENKVINYAFFISWLLMELAVVFSFIPINASMVSLFITSSYYSLGGLLYSSLEKKLFKEVVREYIVVWIVVFLIVFLSIRFS